MNVCVCYYDPDVARMMYPFDATPAELQELQELSAIYESEGNRRACRLRVRAFLAQKIGTNRNFMKVKDTEIFFFCF